MRPSFLRYPNIRLCKIYDPPGGASFGPQKLIETLFVELHWTLSHAKYLRSRTPGFTEEDFKMSSHISTENPFLTIG